MTVVVDASALLSSIIHRRSEGLWAESVIGDEQLTAPRMLPAECSNILRRMEFAGDLSPAEALIAHHDVNAADIELYSFAAFSERVWELRHNVTSYDAWYVALAERLGCPLVTLDLRLSRASGPRCEFLTPPSV